MTKEAETLKKRSRHYCRVRKFLNVLHSSHRIARSEEHEMMSETLFERGKKKTGAGGR
jgi:hypothetical protein